jgi:SAM-dependent methyltransferase
LTTQTTAKLTTVARNDCFRGRPSTVSGVAIANDLWLAANLPFVRAQLPGTGARVLEMGCGPEGGFVPALRRAGHDAVGVDPEAPAAPGYHRVEFERLEQELVVDAVVACVSLHHVSNIDDVLRQVSSVLTSEGVLVVVEWDWELFDEATARWCFARLPPTLDPSEPGWLARHRTRWMESAQSWEVYLARWAAEEGLHPGREILAALDRWFTRRSLKPRPYFFPDLAETTESHVQAAIDAGQIRANGLHYVAVKS